MSTRTFRKHRHSQSFLWLWYHLGFLPVFLPWCQLFTVMILLLLVVFNAVLFLSILWFVLAVLWTFCLKLISVVSVQLNCWRTNVKEPSGPSRLGAPHSSQPLFFFHNHIKEATWNESMHVIHNWSQWLSVGQHWSLGATSDKRLDTTSRGDLHTSRGAERAEGWRDRGIERGREGG